MSGRLARLFDEDTDPESRVTKSLGATFAVGLLLVVSLSMLPLGSGDQYTEFYVLGPDGTASGYPETVTVGEPTELRVGIGNEEGVGRSYTVVLRTDDATLLKRTVSVAAGDVWEGSVEFRFDSTGETALHIELYEGDTVEGDPYRTLRLFVDVTQS